MITTFDAMQVVISAATEKEIELIREIVHTNAHNLTLPFEVSFHISGVGLLASCFSIAQLIFTQKPDIIIQVGIGGSFTQQIPPGAVVAVKEEFLGDSGVEENEVFRDLFDLQLANADEFPFSNRGLENDKIDHWNLTALQVVKGITINQITTNNKRIAVLKEKYNPQIETMEGACLHYCCLKTGISFIQIRAISNFVGERDKSKWLFQESFENLSKELGNYLAALTQKMKTN